MIIPDNLSPLPVFPTSRGPKETPRNEIDGFVCEDTIRKILVGPMLVAPLTTQRSSEESFVGQLDLSPLDEAAVVVLSSDDAYGDELSVEEIQPSETHPALVEPKQTIAPVTRIKGHDRFSHRRNSDRWWVLGMGVALLAVFGSGTLIELISNEAVRRSRISQSANETKTPEADGPKSEKLTGTQSLAASNPEYPAP